MAYLIIPIPKNIALPVPLVSPFFCLTHCLGGLCMPAEPETHCPPTPKDHLSSNQKNLQPIHGLQWNFIIKPEPLYYYYVYYTLMYVLYAYTNIVHLYVQHNTIDVSLLCIYIYIYKHVLCFSDVLATLSRL